MSFLGKAIDFSEWVMRRLDDPETEVAGGVEPAYSVSPTVSVSRDHGIYVYHIPADRLGHGASFGNDRCWAETRAHGNMLSLFSIEAGKQLLNGMSINYLLPFRDLARGDEQTSPQFVHASSNLNGTMHLHPAYQQCEFTIGDGLKVLESFYLPRIYGKTDPAVACTALALENRTDHPVQITVIADLSLRGDTPADLSADYDSRHRAILAANQSKPDWVRCFTSDRAPDHYWVSVDEEEVHNPVRPLPDRIDAKGDLIAALQFNLTILPHQRETLRLLAGISSNGRDAALRDMKLVRDNPNALKQTIHDYHSALAYSQLNLPDDLLTQGVQWAKTCMLRSLGCYKLGRLFTNDPGKSSNVVGRDSAWFVHGCDFMDGATSRGLIDALIGSQRPNGLIAEWIDGNSGESEDHGFNINDNTPLFVSAAVHHLKSTGDRRAAEKIFPAIELACQRILDERGEKGLVWCKADGTGAKGICGWRNIIQGETISGAVTELNAECHGALRGGADVASWIGQAARASQFAEAAKQLRTAINRELIDRKTSLYIRNIDLQQRCITQATVDMVFPMIFGLAEHEQLSAICGRLFDADFMTEAGVRVLPASNSRFDPVAQSGLLGGVWPGATWWLSMGCGDYQPDFMADSLLRSYRHLLSDPKTYNTVPGQFNEWLDGQTLVNNGMRLSPWAAPRFLWAALEGLAGVTIGLDEVRISPKIPAGWKWVALTRMPFHGRELSFVMVRRPDGLHVFSTEQMQTELAFHRYDRIVIDELETLTVGVTALAFVDDKEIIVFVGSNRDSVLNAPLLAHHLLSSHHSYRLSFVDARSKDWTSRGDIDGKDAQRLAVRLEPKGYVLYRFERI